MGVYTEALEPRNNSAVQANSTVIAEHTFSSDGVDNPFGDDYQLNYEERYRQVGTTPWTTVFGIGGYTQHVFTANTFTAGINYERQVRVQSSYNGTWSAWSDSVFFSAVSATPAPTMTAPAAGGTITGPTATVSWSAPTGVEAYRLEVRTAAAGGGTSEWLGPIVTQANALSGTAQFNTNSVSRYVRVAVRKNNLWSAYSERQVNVSYVPPMTPTVVATPVDGGSIGALATLNIQATHPTPAGGAPVVSGQDVYVRHADAPETEVLIAQNANPGLTVYRVPAATLYQVRVVARSVDGRSTTSAWTTATTANVVKGFILGDPATPAIVRVFRYNEDGATDNFDVESAQVEVAGREYPLAEFGQRSTREISVGVVHSKGGADARALLAYMRLRKVLCYRDSKGRKAYGILKVGATQDTFYGHVTAITISATDWPDKDLR